TCDRSAGEPWGRGGAGSRRPSGGAGSARAPAWLDVGGEGAIEQVPEDLRLTDEGGHAAVLHLVGGGVLHDEIDGLQGVAPGARDARAEIRQHVRADPRVV